MRLFNQKQIQENNKKTFSLFLARFLLLLKRRLLNLLWLLCTYHCYCSWFPGILFLWYSDYSRRIRVAATGVIREGKLANSPATNSQFSWNCLGYKERNEIASLKLKESGGSFDIYYDFFWLCIFFQLIISLCSLCLANNDNNDYDAICHKLF
jgi:hypothetical protein